MVTQKRLALILTSAPYGNQYADHMCRVALRAVEKGHSVEIFLYGDGVHAQMGVQAPKDLFPVGPTLRQLMEKGVKVHSCKSSSSARGYGSASTSGRRDEGPANKVIDGVKLVDLFDLVRMLSLSDKVLSFGGG